MDEAFNTANYGSNIDFKDLMYSHRKYSILMVTDFTFPKFGGVETHGYQIS